METKIVNELYFQELNENIEKKGLLDNKKAIINAEVEFDITIGSTIKTIGDILNLSKDDVVLFRKKSDELYDVRVNDVTFAKGETLYIDGKLGVRLLEL